MTSPAVTEPVILSRPPTTPLVDIPLPGFIRRDATGLRVLLDTLDSPALLFSFLDRVFGAGLRFVAADYPLMHKLLYDMAPADIGRWAEQLEAAGRPLDVRLATEMAPFPEERRALYRGFKIGHDESALYLFEPVFIEREVQEPVYETGPDGEPFVICHETRILQERAFLDLDEFMAAAWRNGVRFGWDAARINSEITRHTAEARVSTVEVARPRPPEQGNDASVREQTKSLHRDDAPRMLRDGRVDLAQFRNRFPQIVIHAPLLMKVPRTLGKPGRRIDGVEILPELTRDFSLQDLAGPGTRVENNAEGEWIVATMNGFLNIDAATNQVMVSEKIVNHDGVSVRTTGNLSLQGDDFEEHGEVQERRTVEGMNMTFKSDVFGNVVSRGGRVVFEKYLSGGSAKSDGGSIEVLGSASASLIQARGGEVRMAFAEGSTILARKVEIERASLCTIIAEEVTIGLAEGCTVAAQRIQLDNATARKNVETTVVVLLPDLSDLERKIAETEQQIEDCGVQTQTLSTLLAQLGDSPEMKSFLGIRKKVAAGEIKLSAAQQAQLQALGERLAPLAKKLTDTRTVLKTITGKYGELQQSLLALQSTRQERLAKVSCQIPTVSGDTAVALRTPVANEVPLEQLPIRDLNVSLHKHGPDRRRLFSSDSGSFSWTLADAR